MHPFPHLYKVSADDNGDGPVILSAAGLASIESSAPEEFDGPGNQWSPETLLIAAVADCFLLSFRAVAAASKFDWISINCESMGKLDRVDRTTRFTEITNSVRLLIPTGSEESTARRLLEKAEAICLVSNSLNIDVHLKPTIEVST